MEEETLTGVVERVTFHSEESGFAVLQVKTPGRKELVSVVGHLPLVNTGEYIDAKGTWKIDNRYGLQFEASELRATPPTTTDGIRRYLASGMVYGIGPTYATRLVEAFGQDVFHVIEHEPDRLLTVPGIGPKRKDTIVKSWQRQKAVRRIMLFLVGHGVGPLTAVRIWRTLGENAVEEIRRNPYCLADQVRGIGFKTADKIARELGVSPQSPERARAGLRYALAKTLEEGHVACPREELFSRAAQLLEIPRRNLEPALQAERAEGRLIEEQVGGETWVYLAHLWHAETGVARLLLQLASGRHPLTSLEVQKEIAAAERRARITLSGSQRDAVAKALTEKVLVITGGPGVGKTTIVKVILKAYLRNNRRAVLAAPTGRAAKRLSESCGFAAKTIHRLLEADPNRGGFHRNRRNPLIADLVVVDEASMIDLPLMYHLLQAIPPHAALLLVGDVDQLPSVGPGLVLAQVIQSGRIPTVRLTEIFRQAEASRIVVNAHRVNKGYMPYLRPPSEPADFYYVPAEEPHDVLRLILRLVKERIPSRFGLDPIRDIQVLVPMVRGDIGVRNLNRILAASLNPQPPEHSVDRFGRRLAVGDKVMHLTNDYNKNVFNGDIGFVAKVDRDLGQLEVRYDEDRIVNYSFDELDDLMPAYAVTIHKSQGCEFPAVVVPVHTQHYVMLQRNLLYTAITRGKRLVVIVGSKRALAIAVRRAHTEKRYTALKERLQGLLPLGRAII